MKTKVMERIASWSVNTDGIVQFKYRIDETQYMFCVTKESMQDVLREIGRLAANQKSPMTWNDAAYLTQMIREVVDMLEPKTIDTDDSNVLIGMDAHAIAWSILMMACTSVFALAAFVFVMWGR